MVKAFLYFLRQCIVVFSFITLSSLVLAQEQEVVDTVSNPSLIGSSPALSAAAMPQNTPLNMIEHDLSPWSMYLNADIVVKAIMILLLIASVVTWTIFMTKSIELFIAKRRLKREMTSLKSSKTLKQAGEVCNNFASIASLSTVIISDIQDELDLSVNMTSNEGIKERAAFRQDRLVAASGRKMSTGISILASIGSVSPFVGLFGTVWGIMNSFIGIAKSQTTNLAVVAPGIAEALLATALGLVAAIPAVIIYNLFVRSIGHYKVLVSDISAHGLLLLSRDLDRKKEAISAPQVVPASISKFVK